MPEGSIRKGMRDAASKKRAKRESESLNDVVEKAQQERPGKVQKAVKEFFERKPGEGKSQPWETEGKGLAPDGGFLTLEDLINLKPFQMDELNTTVAFRANEKMMRWFQRVREASGGVYDIMSDLYRDAAGIGLLVLSERYKSILGPEIVIARARALQDTIEEARDIILNLKEALKPLPPTIAKAHFHSFMVAMEDKPRWIQEAYLEEMKTDKMLAEMLSELEESDEGA